jgi:hypothetical protein
LLDKHIAEGSFGGEVRQLGHPVKSLVVRKHFDDSYFNFSSNYFFSFLQTIYRLDRYILKIQPKGQVNKRDYNLSWFFHVIVFLIPCYVIKFGFCWWKRILTRGYTIVNNSTQGTQKDFSCKYFKFSIHECFLQQIIFWV